MNLSVINRDGQNTGRTVSLPETIFAIAPNEHAVYLDVKHHLANQRQGTHKAKERAEIARTTKKLKKQKGTGGARAGSMKSPVFVGGGRIFGPRPRNYHFKLNIKLKRLARKSAFAYKAKNDSLIVLEDLNFDAIKTKSFISLINNLELANDKVLFILGSQNDNVYLSSRNLKRVKVVTADSVNTYDVLNAKKVVMAQSSIEVIEKILN
jgi:large subunit ribosomal protein L4